MDAVVIFDNVLVAWELLFLYGQPEFCYQAFGTTNAVVHMVHQVVNLDARDRVALYRLAHDVAVSGLGSHHTLYERFFFGPPHLMNAAYFDLYDKDRVTERVDALLAEG